MVVLARIGRPSGSAPGENRFTVSRTAKRVYYSAVFRDQNRKSHLRATCECDHPSEITLYNSRTIPEHECFRGRRETRALIAENKRLVIDLSNVDYLDSSGLGMIVGVYITAKKANCQLRLINLSPRVKEIFALHPAR